MVEIEAIFQESMRENGEEIKVAKKHAYYVRRLAVQPRKMPQNCQCS